MPHHSLRLHPFHRIRILADMAQPGVDRLPHLGFFLDLGRFIARGNRLALREREN
jgi:hypothetical protein